MHIVWECKSKSKSDEIDDVSNSDDSEKADSKDASNDGGDLTSNHESLSWSDNWLSLSDIDGDVCCDGSRLVSVGSKVFVLTGSNWVNSSLVTSRWKSLLSCLLWLVGGNVSGSDVQVSWYEWSTSGCAAAMPSLTVTTDASDEGPADNYNESRRMPVQQKSYRMSSLGYRWITWYVLVASRWN